VRDGDRMASWWRTLLDAQRRAGFRDLAGSEGNLQLMLSDALLNDLIAAWLPPAWPITALTLHALGRNEVAVRVRPRTGWLPPIKVVMTIDQRPATAAAPLLCARFTSSIGGLVSFVLRHAEIPGWIRLSGNDVAIDLHALAASYGLDDMLPTLQRITLGTEVGRFVLTTALAVSPSDEDAGA
jgi:hypothetical protein